MSTDRALLRLVPAPVDGAPDVHFCGHCGEPPPTPMAARARVCVLCGLGVVLSAGAAVAPQRHEPFVIIDGTLALCALSRTAERLLGVEEPDAVNRHVADFLEPADAEPRSSDELLRAILDVASGRAAAQTTVVRPTGEYGVRYAARLGRCGPPPGALLVFADDIV